MKSKQLFLTFLALLGPLTTRAYDAEIDGIYYNFSGTSAIVTYETTSYNSYSGEVIIPESVTYNGTVYSVTGIGDRAFDGCIGLTSVIIPNSVTTIGHYAFEGCSGLTSVTMPDQVITFTGYYVFGGVNYIKEVHITNLTAWLHTSFQYGNNPLRNGAKLFLNGEELKHLIIPESITTIQTAAFEGCESLESVVLHENISSFASNAYNGYAFSGCTNLTEVIALMPTPVTIQSTDFSNRTNATLYVPEGYKATYEAVDYWNQFKNIVEFPNPDVNQDGDVDVVDVVDIARFVVGTPATTFVKILADLNLDGDVNVSDAVMLVNEIAGDLYFVKGQYALQASTYDYDDCELQLLRKGNNGLAFCIDGKTDFTAFQFVMEVPEGTEVTAMHLNGERKQGHQLLYNKVTDGIYRVAVLSVANSIFRGSEDELLGISLDSAAADGICIRDIHFVNTAGKDFTFDALYLGDGMVTSVESTNTQRDAIIYDLQGRQRSTLQRGVNIVNGKKVLVR